MKIKRLALAVSICTALSACATYSPGEGPTYIVGPEYNASGSVAGVRAYVYGGRTLLHYEDRPLSLTVRDQYGKRVSYERVGNYYRLDQELDQFSTRANLIRTTNFSQVVKAPPIAPPQKVSPPPVARERINDASAVKLERQDDAQLRAVLDTAALQLADVRASIEQGAPDLQTLERLHKKLDQIELELADASAAVVMVHFERYKTDFAPGTELGDLLVAVANTAALVKLRGRTDSVVPGPRDAQIAKQRAQSAKSYLVERGVSPAKIEVSSLPAGDFIAPNTYAGKALNRRVEIEFVSARLKQLREQASERLADARQAL